MNYLIFESTLIDHFARLSLSLAHICEFGRWDMNHLIKIHYTVIVNEMLPKGKGDIIKWDVNQTSYNFL